jgi:hypothetical protein
MDTYGYIYNSSFVPVAPVKNLMASDDDSAGNLQFGFYVELDTSTTYFLVVTTYNQMVTGNFSIIATGLASITFSPINSSGKS